jgi:hypothetical protein
MKPEEGYHIIKIPRGNLVTKEEIKEKLQASYNACAVKHNEAKRDNLTLSTIHYHGMIVAIIRLSEAFGVTLDKD